MGELTDPFSGAVDKLQKIRAQGLLNGLRHELGRNDSNVEGSSVSESYALAYGFNWG